MARRHYELIPPASKQVYRPIVAIQLGNPDTRKVTPEIRALIDSGSDICMAPKELALWLEIEFDNYDETVTIQTANNSLASAVKKRVAFSIPEGSYKCPFFFVDGLDPNQPVLLGQQGFFDHFKICFDFVDKSFEVERP